MPEPTTFETSGLTCEQWYGYGDPRCMPNYSPTGDLLRDIELIKGHIQRLSYESGRRDCYSVSGCQEEKKRQMDNLKIILQEKQSEESSILASEQVAETILSSIVTLESEVREQEKSLAGFHPQHYIRQSIEAQIKQLKEQIIQKKTRH